MPKLFVQLTADVFRNVACFRFQLMKQQSVKMRGAAQDVKKGGNGRRTHLSDLEAKPLVKKRKSKRSSEKIAETHRSASLKEAVDDPDAQEPLRLPVEKSNEEIPASNDVQEEPSTEASASSGAVLPKTRYILFVGNLPYGITVAQIRQFFKSQDVTNVRLLTSKGTQQPRGCAFVEFESSKGYVAGLSFHRKLLDGRRIRVERTAGGGGKSASRMEKIKKCNKKLHRTREKFWKVRCERASAETK